MNYVVLHIMFKYCFRYFERLNKACINDFLIVVDDDTKIDSTVGGQSFLLRGTPGIPPFTPF